MTPLPHYHIVHGPEAARRFFKSSRFFVGVNAGFGGGAGRYSIVTLLMTAMGRPGDEYVAVPSRRSTVSFEDRRH